MALIAFSLLFSLAGRLSCAVSADDDTLELLQVFSRHGNRTALGVIPEYETWYMETFQPFQFGQLTPAGRRQMFNLGKYLRQRYASFLPEEFSYADISIRCTGTLRVQESSGVAMAAMFPPKYKQKWQNFGLGAEYTPIPCQYLPEDQDMVLDPSSVDCPRYKTLVNGFMNSTYFLNKYNELTNNGSLNKYIQVSLNASTPMDMNGLFTVWENFLTMRDYKLPLPSWSTSVFPEPLTEIVTYTFIGVYFNVEMIRFSVGNFLKELLETATILERGLPVPFPNSRKLFAYFGHDKTMYPLLVAFGFERMPPICMFGASLIMELHRNKSTSEIGYKFLYRNSTVSDPLLYTVPGCQEICPLSYIKKILEPYIPTKPVMSYCYD